MEIIRQAPFGNFYINSLSVFLDTLFIASSLLFQSFPNIPLSSANWFFFHFIQPERMYVSIFTSNLCVLSSPKRDFGFFNVLEKEKKRKWKL